MSEINEVKDFIKFLNLLRQEKIGKNIDPINIKHFAFNSIINLPIEKKYIHFLIPKKNGKFRHIFAPNPQLKTIQHTILEILKAYYSPIPNVTGYVNRKSIVDNALPHIGKKYILNIDIKDFFTSISGERVYKRLHEPPFNFPDKIAYIIMRICCEDTSNKLYKKQILYGQVKSWERIRKHLPQGAPTSPILSNAVCDKMDSQIIELCKAFDVTYTRYADDLTFSCMDNVFIKNKKNTITYNNTISIIPVMPNPWDSESMTPECQNQNTMQTVQHYDKSTNDFMSELKRIIYPFTINNNKTHLQKKGKHQEVTSLVISDKINVRKSYIKSLRNILYIWEKYGYSEAEKCFIKYCLNNNNEISNTKLNAHLDNVIKGKLDFLKMVRGKDDLLYLNFNKKYEALYTELKKNIKSNTNSSVLIKLSNGTKLKCKIINYNIPKSITIELAGKRQDIDMNIINSIEEM